jgi:glycerol kinase
MTLKCRKKTLQMRHILALDQGTTSSRAIVFDSQGQVVARAQQELRLIYPAPAWVEVDANDIWHSQLMVARAALASSPDITISALGLTNQRETTILWDRTTGEAISNAIVWQDRRTTALCEQLREAGKLEMIQQKTGLILDPYFSATKLAWLLEHVPGARARAERGELCFGTVDSWLIFKLTGGRHHLTDMSNASRTMLFNLHTQKWDDDLLALFNIPHQLLPEIVASSGICGYTDKVFFGREIAIAGIAGDQQAATFGQACHRPGMAKNTYGTGCFLMQNTGQQALASQHQLLTTVGWQLDGATTFLLEGSVFMAGATIQWLRDALGIIKHASEVEKLAASVPNSGGTILVPAFTGLGAPYWDPAARGTLLGMTRGTGKAHIARAALESIALQSADLLQAMEQDAGTPLYQLRVDGGACSNDLLMQYQSDVLGVPVLRPRVIETTALGAAYLAGLACGIWAGIDEIEAQWQLEKEFTPSYSADQRADVVGRWRRAVRFVRGWQEESNSQDNNN